MNVGTVLIAAHSEAEGLKALIAAYAMLNDIHCNWPGRDTAEGQRMLCHMRDSIAEATSAASEYVQNVCSMARVA